MDTTNGASVRRVTITLLVAGAMMSASNSVIFALLPGMQDRFGFSSAGLGIITAAGFGTSFVVQLFVAPLADRGHPRVFLFIGAAGSILGNLMCAASSGLWTIVLGRALLGAGTGSYLPTARALMSSLGTEGRAARLGRLESMGTAGFVVGPVIGGLLVGPLGVRWPFVIFCVMAVGAGSVLSMTRLPELPRRHDSNRIAFDLLRRRPMVVAILLAVSLGLPIGMYDALWARYLTDLGASPVMVGISIAFYAAPYVLLAGFGGRLADRMGALPLALRALLFITPLTISYSLFHNPWFPISIGIIEAFVQACAIPATQSVVASAAPHGRTAAGQGLAGAVNVGVMALIAVISSAMYGAYGVRVTFISVAAAALAVGLLARWLARGRLLEQAETPAPDALAVVESTS